MMLFVAPISVSLCFYSVFSQNTCFGLILSTEKDHAVQCFIANEYSEISAYLSLLHTLQEASSYKTVLRQGEHFTLSVHKGCPRPKEKYEAKKPPNLVMEKQRRAGSC